ncbi:MAG: tetratricopeptide repeat protein [Planctomycetota bacterium]|nr:tetratricopeptide repeat protein [Planctomycetota bacterium]
MRVDLQRLKRDSGSRRVAVASELDAATETASFHAGSTTQVMPVASDSLGAPSQSGAHDLIVAHSLPVAQSGPVAQDVPGGSPAVPGVPDTKRLPAATVPAARRFSPMMLGAAALFLGGLVVMIGVAWFINRARVVEESPVVEQTIPAPPAATDVPSPLPPPEAPPVPVNTTAAAPIAPPTVTPPTVAAKPPTAGRNASTVAPGTPVAPKPPAVTAKTPPVVPMPAEPAPSAPAGPTPEETANTRLDIARAKINSNLLEPALADLRQIMNEFPGSSAAADALFMSAGVLEKLARIDDAMATHVEFSKRFPTNRLIASSQLRLAELTEKSRLRNREAAASAILGEVIRAHPRTPETLRALQMKIRLDQDNRQRVLDPVVNVQVPLVLPTLRTLTEQFPNAVVAMTAFNRLADMYTDLDQHERAAQAYVDMATNFPKNPHDAWFRAGEIYERRLKAMDKAREAYGKVPEGSSRYRDAQRKLNQKP